MEGFDVGPWEDSGSYDGYSFEIVFELRNGETITETYNPLSLENALCQPTLWDELNKIGIHNYTWEDIDDFESGNVIAKRMRDRRYQRIMNQLCEN